MILVDANLLIYALNVESPQHERAHSWLDDRLNGPVGVGLPWPVLQAFVRIISNPRVLPNAMPPAQAWAQVEEWLELDATFTPEPRLRQATPLAGTAPRRNHSSRLFPTTPPGPLVPPPPAPHPSAPTDRAPR
jgi:toxin-antitoxin system PIN domain toxin